MLTASKPRNEYAETAAPAAIAAKPPAPVKGVVETSVSEWETRCAIESATKMARMSSWKVINTKLVRSATLSPMMLSVEVMRMNATIHTQNGTPGNSPDRYAPPMSQITSGRNR